MGSNRVLLTTWVRTGYCGVHGRMTPPPSFADPEFKSLPPMAEFSDYHALYKNSKIRIKFTFKCLVFETENVSKVQFIIFHYQSLN